ncbi:MAG TPA: DUF6036 family nucleotidyltransferase [Candidatus Acidoferrales bacterium]|nr:DUF6036 family nucleotidyltransferase [Candidatus Acidoferrales bacterium]
MSHELVSPWAEFLEEFDTLLDERFVLHCIGGFAVVAAYGLPRSTNDLDYYSLIPANRTGYFEELAGAGSTLARKYKVHIHSARVTSLPENYDERLTRLFPGRFKNLGLFVPDPYDLALSKLSRNAEVDREDVKYLAATQNLRAEVLRERFEREYIAIGPPERDKNTLAFWIEAYFSSDD